MHVVEPAGPGVFRCGRGVAALSGWRPPGVDEKPTPVRRRICNGRLRERLPGKMQLLAL
jgi:hypothetical protein